MYTSRLLGFIATALLLLALSAAAWRPASGAEVLRTAGEPIVIEVNEGHLVRIDAPATAVFVANPEIADVAVKSPRLIYVFGKKAGETTLYAVDEQEQILLNALVRITHNLSGLQQALGDLLPQAEVEAQSMDGGLVLSGAVATAVEAEDARRLATRFVGEGGEVISRLSVTAANQVNLRVRIAEVSRDVVRQLGIDWSIAGDPGGINFGLITRSFPVFAAEFGIDQSTDLLSLSASALGIDFDSFINALETENLITVLAEPNLTALSGETASFLAGGEFPIPVRQEQSTTIEFKKFGVSLSFTPTVLSEKRISLRVRPEVSALSDAGAVVVEGFNVPSLTVRRAETTVELGSGQTFAIAGLISTDFGQSFSEVPGLGDIPILGELFKSEKFERGDTELVILVTPYIVQPVSDQRLALPTDTTTGPEGSQRLSLGSTGQPLSGAAGAPAGLVGPVGFVIE